IAARAGQKLAVGAEREAARDAAVVEVGGDACARIERVERLIAVAREEKSPGVHGRGAVGRRIVGRLGVREGELGEREGVVSPGMAARDPAAANPIAQALEWVAERGSRSEEHTSELQSLTNLVCRLLLEKNTH